jgi:hypothetical protein
MEQYLRVKRAAQQSFIDCGATLSHHHAVGTEHLPWLAADISPLGVQAVGAIKRGLDPGNIMNPGRLNPSANPFEEWMHPGNRAGFGLAASVLPAAGPETMPARRRAASGES